MKERDELFGFVAAGAEEGDLPSFASALDAYRDAVLREAADRIGEDVRQRYSRVISVWGTDRARDWVLGGLDAANLIEPEVKA